MKLGRTEHVPQSACPWCGHPSDARAEVEGEERRADPVEGDVSICLYCTAVAVYTEDLSLRKPTELEEPLLLADPAIHAGRQMAARARMRRAFGGFLR